MNWKKTGSIGAVAGFVLGCVGTAILASIVMVGLAGTTTLSSKDQAAFVFNLVVLAAPAGLVGAVVLGSLGILVGGIIQSRKPAPITEESQDSKPPSV